MTALCLFLLGPNTVECLPPPPPVPITLELREVFVAAGIPPPLWGDFATVAWGESRWENDAQNGSAKGLFQLHWHLWSKWAEEEGLGTFTNWRDPVQNARLAYLVGEFYDLPRHDNRWFQWQVKPWWSSVQEWKEFSHAEVLFESVATVRFGKSGSARGLGKPGE